MAELQLMTEAIPVIELTPWERLRLAAKALRTVGRVCLKEQIVPGEFGFDPAQYELFAQICSNGSRYLLNEADKKQERYVLYGRIAEQVAAKFGGKDDNTS